MAELMDVEGMSAWRAEYLPKVNALHDELEAIDAARCALLKLLENKLKVRPGELAHITLDLMLNHRGYRAD